MIMSNNNHKATMGLKPAITIYLGATLVSLLPLPVLAGDMVPLTPSDVIQSTESLVYPADFFARYSPRNALEMINRLPGFSFDEGASDRGFGNNAGNVLIDGSRPTTKSGGLSAALTRIPASQVVRIEILHGNAGEAAGHAIVANIVSSKTLTHGTWTMRIKQTASTQIEPNLEAAISTPLGLWEAAFDMDIGVDPHYRSALIEQQNKADELLWAATEVYPSSNRYAYFNGKGARAAAGGKLTFNGRFAADDFKGDTNRNTYTNRLPDSSEPDSYWTLNEKNTSRLGELGVDWLSSNDEWKLRLLGLAVVKDSRYQYDLNQQDSDETMIDSTYVQDRLKTELVSRATLGTVADVAFKPEFGIEVANNRLDTDAVFSQRELFEPVFGSDVVVQEWRGEAFANFVYQAGSAFSVEGGLTAEVSQIKVSGDAKRQQTFQFIKPRLSASYQLNKQMRLTFEAERRVGQLNFNDFAANSVASEKRTTAGNPKLAPDQTSEIATTFDWHFSERGSLKIKAFRQWRSDILEQIVLSTNEQGETSMGLGNAGDAQTWGVISELKLPLDYILHNGLIDITYRYRQSHFDDPVIGQDRAISNYTPDWLRFDFRQDLNAQQFTWGLGYLGSFNYDSFLVDEIQTNSANKVLTFFIETTRFFGVKTRFEVSRFNTARYPRTRHFYEGTRSGEYLGSEIAQREHRPYFMLSVLGDF
ncbi:MAG: hypothetical protein ACI8WB_005621 [Phenylobacterium sp.]|jgi:hypothetical protein